MNARLDIDHNGARVTRDGRTYQVKVRFLINADDADDARIWTADTLAGLAESVLLSEALSGLVRDEDNFLLGEWSIEP